MALTQKYFNTSINLEHLHLFFNSVKNCTFRPEQHYDQNQIFCSYTKWISTTDQKHWRKFRKIIILWVQFFCKLKLAVVFQWGVFPCSCPTGWPPCRAHFSSAHQCGSSRSCSQKSLVAWHWPFALRLAQNQQGSTQQKQTRSSAQGNSSAKSRVAYVSSQLQADSTFQRPFIWTKHQCSIFIRSWDMTNSVLNFY